MAEKRNKMADKFTEKTDKFTDKSDKTDKNFVRAGELSSPCNNLNNNEYIQHWIYNKYKYNL